MAVPHVVAANKHWDVNSETSQVAALVQISSEECRIQGVGGGMTEGGLGDPHNTGAASI